ncbi:unnamed protein product [Arabidopsis thaliana]|uniref:(thale cress) hypothetical protein n=1 Tax=Arabidopsis thaliana TaxID=3702 RepID=A0A7G2F002_ARATH|nr:unnamed protein product [Arabidopsis thaliana]
MASSKAKKGLGDMFRHAMRHHKKSLDGSHETVSSTSVPEFGQDHYKEKHSNVMKKLEEGLARKLGIENLFTVCAKMGKEVSVNEYKGMIKVCIHSARISDDVEAALYHIRKAIEYLKEINKCGSIIGKGTYVPLLKFLADMGMVEEFQISKDVILEANPDALGKVGYYEMLLWIQVHDEEKIHQLCSRINDSENSLSILQVEFCHCSGFS